ncbi:hypothetical protein C8F01DRAFT_1133791 [Mycena amicta]|nr:hypothetical protein C8F01DRAFT_1133791 [Mycena amicta]
MSRAKVECDVCLERFGLDMFRVLPTCGHGLCIACTAKTHANPNCVICRKPKKGKEPIQIYLTIVDANPLERALSVTENLGKIDGDAAPASLQKAGIKIRQAIRTLQPNDTVARELLEAAKNLDERISPTFTELKAVNANLIEEAQNLREQLKMAQSQAGEIRQLRKSLSEAEQRHKKSAASAERRKAAVETEKDENARLNRVIVQQDSVVAEKEAEVDKLRAKIERRDNRVTVLEKKLKIMSRQAAKRSRPDENDADESLQIEHSAEVG